MISLYFVAESPSPTRAWPSPTRGHHGWHRCALRVRIRGDAAGVERGTFKECVVNINFCTYVVYMFVYVHQLYYDTYVLRNIYIYIHDVHYVSIGIHTYN